MKNRLSSGLTLQWWLLRGAFALQPGRWLIACAAVAFGVALGTSIHTVNHSALGEFNRAIARVNGQADAFITARFGFFDDAILDTLSEINARRDELFEGRHPDPFQVSPRLELTVQPGSLRLIGLDVFRAAAITPQWIPSVSSNGASSSVFSDDTVFLSKQAWAALPKDASREPGTGVRQRLQWGESGFDFRLAEGLDRVSGTEKLAVMDIAAMQWRFNLPGKLSRIDLQLPGDWSVDEIRAALQRIAPSLDGLIAVNAADASQQRQSNLSRAYRVNLNVLALVALFTGGFLVFSSIGLAAIRQRVRFGVLGCMGAPAGLIYRAMLTQGVLVGLLGGLLGTGMGLLLARLLLGAIGADLGGGYFAGANATLQLDWPVLLLYIAGSAVLGIVAAWYPARVIAKAKPTDNMRPAASDLSGASWHWSAVLLLAGAGLQSLPAIQGIPWPAYVAIALWLIGGIAIVPRLVLVLTIVARQAARWAVPKGLWRSPAAWLAWQRVQHAPAAGVSVIAGVVASFALTCAMATMVHSFRSAVSEWLTQVLPADLYVRGPVAGLTQAHKDAIAGAGRKVEFLRVRELQVRDDLYPLTLLARKLPADNVQGLLPLAGAVVPAPTSSYPIYISEAVATLYGWKPGQIVKLPIKPGVEFFVSAVWRDYSRQTGAIAIDKDLYQSLTADAQVNDAAIWIEGHRKQDIDALTSRLAGFEELQTRSADGIRQVSLSIFDRSFAVTYALELAAILVGMFGLGAAFSAQAIARQAEFGMLRQLGYRPQQIRAQLALEAALLTAIGSFWGLLLGLAIAAILVFRVNPQSFFWTMSMTVPWATLAAAGLMLIACSALTALLSTRGLLSQDAIAAVRIGT